MAHAHTHASADDHAHQDDGAESNENNEPDREPDGVLVGEKRWGRGGGGAIFSGLASRAWEGRAGIAAIIGHD